MLQADLYLKSIDLSRYVQEPNCSECGFTTCDDFLEAVIAGANDVEKCPFVRGNQLYAFRTLEKIKKLWPEVPLLTFPTPAPAGLIEVNSPDEHSLVLISGNNEYTQEVLMTVLGTTLCPFYVVFADTDGNTIDMAMIYKTFTAERVSNAIRSSGIKEKIAIKQMVIPGLAASLREDIIMATGWDVRIGPECAAELPLYFSEIWIPP